MTSRRWKIATIVLAVVAALGWASTPATGHVADWADTWSAHIKPRTDQRYYTKAETDVRYVRKVAPGRIISGFWAVGGGNGAFGVATIVFPGRVEETITPVYARHASKRCPGAGKAAAGYLCVYPRWNYNLSFSAFLDPGSRHYGVGRRGTVLSMASATAQGNARGTWTVHLPEAGAPRVVAPRVRLDPALGE
jgi:hypothetical protein